MKIQNKYMQTYLDDMGKLLGYRITFPIPKEFAIRYIKESHRQCVNNRYYYINQSLNHKRLLDTVNVLQIMVRNWKIKKLQDEVSNLRRTNNN
jgi:hypothetical protein